MTGVDTSLTAQVVSFSWRTSRVGSRVVLGGVGTLLAVVGHGLLSCFIVCNE